MTNREEILCRGCGKPLTSPRSRKKGIGQRCWRKERGLPPLTWKPKNPIDSVPYTVTGSKDYVQLTLGEFE